MPCLFYLLPSFNQENIQKKHDRLVETAPDRSGTVSASSKGHTVHFHQPCCESVAQASSFKVLHDISVLQVLQDTDAVWWPIKSNRNLFVPHLNINGLPFHHTSFRKAGIIYIDDKNLVSLFIGHEKLLCGHMIILMNQSWLHSLHFKKTKVLHRHLWFHK